MQIERISAGYNRSGFKSDTRLAGVFPSYLMIFQG